MIAVDGVKRCSKCKTAKPVVEFTRNRNYHDGLWVYCKPCCTDLKRLTYLKHREKILRSSRLSSKVYRQNLRSEAIAAYGGACVCCGEVETEFLSFDHVEGGGKKHRAAIGGSGQQLYRWLKQHEYPSVVRLLCHNCNQAFGLYGYCPHQSQTSLQVVA